MATGRVDSPSFSINCTSAFVGAAKLMILNGPLRGLTDFQLSLVTLLDHHSVSSLLLQFLMCVS